MQPLRVRERAPLCAFAKYSPVAFSQVCKKGLSFQTCTIDTSEKDLLKSAMHIWSWPVFYLSLNI